MRTLLIDNYDSSAFNLFHLPGEVNAVPLDAGRRVAVAARSPSG